MKFQVYQVSLELIRSLPPILAKIRARSASLALQAENAASSVPLNLAEGHQRVGKDRNHHFRIAAGSAEELQACLDVAEAWGYVARPEITASTTLIDRILAMTYRLTH